jgi:hypothetical protein
MVMRRPSTKAVATKVASVIAVGIAVVAIWTVVRSRTTAVPIFGARVLADGSSIVLTLPGADEGGGCWKDGRTDVSVNSFMVTVSVRGVRSRFPDCTEFKSRVTLAAPLGRRVVRDAATGKAVSLLPVPMPEPTWLPDGWTARTEGGNENSWTITVGNGTADGVQIRLFRTGSTLELVGATIVSDLQVGSRRAAFVRSRSGHSSASSSLVMMDPTWTLTVSDPFRGSVDDPTTQRIAERLTSLPFAESLDAPRFDPVRTGSVSSLAFYEGPATITAWVSVDKVGTLWLCDKLDSEGACVQPAIEAVWKRDGAGSPPDLVSQGMYRVSTGPLVFPVEILGGRAVVVP